MSPHLVSLKWNYHYQSLLQVLSCVRLKGLFSDVTVFCNGKYYQLHKIILSMCSDYFEQIFLTINTSNPIIVLKDMQNDDFEVILDYIYSGEVSIEECKLASLIKTAEFLEIKGFDLSRPHNQMELENKTIGIIPSEKVVPREQEDVQLVHHQENKRRRLCEPSPLPPPPPIHDHEMIGQQNETVILAHSQPQDFDNDPKEEPLYKDDTDLMDVKPALSNMDLKFLAATANSNGNIQHFEHQITNDDAALASTSSIPKSTNASIISLPHSYAATSGLQEEINDNMLDRLSDDQPLHIKLDDNEASSSANGSDLSYPQSMSNLWCKYCMKTFGDQTSLTKHEQSHLSMVNSSKILPCPHCEYQTSIKESLRCHLRTHTGERPYSCPHCNFRGATRATINRHINSHSHQRPFQCPYCTYKAARKDNLNLHIRKLHLKENTQQLSFAK